MLKQRIIPKPKNYMDPDSDFFAVPRMRLPSATLFQRHPSSQNGPGVQLPELSSFEGS